MKAQKSWFEVPNSPWFSTLSPQWLNTVKRYLDPEFPDNWLYNKHDYAIQLVRAIAVIEKLAADKAELQNKLDQIKKEL